MTKRRQRRSNINVKRHYPMIKSWIRMACLIAATVSLVESAQAAAYLRVVSWNTRHEGWSGETDYAGAAAQISRSLGATVG